MIVYLSGPMEFCTAEQSRGWREEARDALSDKVEVIIPAFADPTDDASLSAMVEGDKADIDRSDVVLANPWKVSVGTSMEIIHARGRGKIIVTVARPDGYVNPWVRYHSTYVVPDLTHAVRIIRQLAR